MSILKPGTLCVIVAGCPENIGQIVKIIRHMGPYPPCADGYIICTVTGRDFPQLKTGPNLRLEPGQSIFALTDRYKLRPLIDSSLDDEEVSNSCQTVAG